MRERPTDDFDARDLDVCIRCGCYVETINGQPGARCPHCGVRLDVTHSITFEEQEEAVRLGCRVCPLIGTEHAEIIDGRWCLVADGEESLAAGHIADALDRLLGFIYRTATVANPEGRKF